MLPQAMIAVRYFGTARDDIPRRGVLGDQAAVGSLEELLELAEPARTLRDHPRAPGRLGLAEGHLGARAADVRAVGENRDLVLPGHERDRRRDAARLGVEKHPLDATQIETVVAAGRTVAPTR